MALYQTRKTKFQRLEDWLDAKVFNWAIRRRLYLHIAAQIENGLSIETALDSFRRSLKRQRKKSADKIVLGIIRLKKDGATFAASLKKWVPNDEYQMLEAGERSGRIQVALEFLVETKDRVMNIKRAYLKSLIAPGIYLVMIYGLLWVLGNYVVIDFFKIIPKATSTGLIHMLYVLSDFATSAWVLLVPALSVALIVLVRAAMPRWTGRGRIFAERYFPFNFYRDMQGYVWLMSFVSMLKAGIGDLEILKKQIPSANPWLAERLRAFVLRMENGSSFSKSLLMEGKHHFPVFDFPNPEIVDVIESLDGFPDFPDKINVTAKRWSMTLEEKLLDQSKVMGFVAEMVTFVMIGLLMIAINDMTMQAGTAAVR